MERALHVFKLHRETPLQRVARRGLSLGPGKEAPGSPSPLRWATALLGTMRSPHGTH